MNTIPERLKGLRKQRNLTQNHLARIAGVTPGQVSQYESGRCAIGIANLKKIAGALKCSLNDIDERYTPENEIGANGHHNKGHRYIVDEMLLLVVDYWNEIPVETRADVVALIRAAAKFTAAAPPVKSGKKR